MKYSGEIGELVQQITDKAEELERKLNDVSGDVLAAETEAFQRGVTAGLNSKEMNFEGKTLVFQVPDDMIEEVTSSSAKLRRQFKCNIIVCSDLAQIKDLHELDLRAIGLKKIE